MQLLLNLLMVLCEHNDHLTVSSILMNSKTEQVILITLYFENKVSHGI